MKILNCHIEGFGKIEKESFSFNSGITSFNFANGHGKTTLAAFIKAMLFGLESVKKNSKNFEDRLHFAPFSGARFGGSITILFKNSEYKIERFFDRKSQVKDTLCIYKNGKVTTEVGDEVGEFFFGLDKESFERVLFMRAGDEFFGSTDGISTKLNRFCESDGDFAAASEILISAGRKLRAARGSNDLISHENEKRLSLIAEIQNLERISEELGKLYEVRNEISDEIKRLELLEKQENELQVREQILKNHTRLTERELMLKERIAAFKDKYQGGIPSEEEIAAIKSSLYESEKNRGALGATRLSSDTSERLSELSAKFDKGYPSADMLSSVDLKIKNLASLSDSLSQMKSEQQSGGDFERGLPKEPELKEQKLKFEEYKSCASEIESLVSSGAATSRRSLKKAPFILGILFAAASVPLVLVHIAAFAAALILGVIFICLSVIKFGGSEALSIKIAELKVKRDSLADSLKLFLSKYGFFTESGPLFDFPNFENAYYERLRLNEERDTELSRKREIINEISAEKAELSAFFEKFGMAAGSFAESLYSLRSDISEYQRLLAERKKVDADKDCIRDSIKSLESSVHSVLSKYGLSGISVTALPEYISSLENDRRELVSLISEAEEARAEKLAFEKENSIDDKAVADAKAASSNEREAPERLPAMRRALANKDSEIRDIEERLEALPEKQNALENTEERLAELRHKLFIITKTQELLKTANQNILERYVAPVKLRFSAYISEISNILGESFSMDFDFNLRFDAAGESRDERHLNSGGHAIVALALRLAFLDVLFDKEAPFVIMDDPFVSLDEENLKKVLSLIKKLSEKIQIVYFSCHNSRNI